ncbi:MAG TPA: 2-oxo acid dehydrogenase subunit E2 [Anaerolineae bacterium]|nr:2-oxo acid dehydrogenase subunit E2 [Anaerolineae bacterium]
MANETPAQYEVIPFPRMRHLVIDILRTSHRKHMIHGLVEVDVTRARQYIREREASTGEQLSFTAFVAICLGKAVDMNKYLHAMRNWRGQLVLFDEVDVNTMIEVEIEGHKIPMAHIFRAVNKRPYQDINAEIQTAQAVGGQSEVGTFLLKFASLPRFMRAPFYWLRNRSPHTSKEYAGTVLLTAVGMFGEGGGWGIPLAPFTLNVTLGGIAEKPGVVDGRIEIREYLSLTVSFDHDIIDGAPAARFTECFKDLIENAYGLTEQYVAAGEA